MLYLRSGSIAPVCCYRSFCLFEIVFHIIVVASDWLTTFIIRSLLREALLSICLPIAWSTSYGTHKIIKILCLVVPQALVPVGASR